MLRWPRFMKAKLPLETERVQPYTTIAMPPVINTIMIVTPNKDDIIAMIIFKNDNGLPPEAVIITTINEL